MSDTFDFARLIREGDCVAWSGAAAEPTGLVERFSAALPALPRCTGFASVGLTLALDPRQVAGRLRLRALGGTGTNRRFQAVGALDVLPAHYGALPDLVTDGTLKFDVVLTMLSVDAAGWNLGPQVDGLLEVEPGNDFLGRRSGDTRRLSIGGSGNPQRPAQPHSSGDFRIEVEGGIRPEPASEKEG